MKVDDVNNSDGKASLKRQKLGTIAQFFHFVAEEKKKDDKIVEWILTCHLQK